MTNVDRILAEAMKLSDEDRAELTARLLDAKPEMSAEERTRLDAEIERGFDDIEAGRVVDGRNVIAKLRARSA
jgi:predicted transcriptional regulator